MTAKRGILHTNENVLITGVIVRAGDPRNVLFRGIGPELTAKNVQGALQDPKLELRDSDGTLVEANDNWQQAANAAEIQATGIAPTDPREPAILRKLSPGNYTAIVSGVGGTTGIGLVESYKVEK